MKPITIRITATTSSDASGKWGTNYSGKAGPNVDSGSWFGGGMPWTFKTREAAVESLRIKAADEAKWFEFYGRPIILKLTVDGKKEVINLAKTGKAGKPTDEKKTKGAELDKNMVKTYRMLKEMEAICGELSMELRREGSLYWQCANVSKQLDAAEATLGSARQVLLLTMYEVSEGDDIEDLVKDVDLEIESQEAEEQVTETETKETTLVPVTAGQASEYDGYYPEYGI